MCNNECVRLKGNMGDNPVMTDNATAEAVPELIPQAHGGALRRGGIQANMGNRMPALKPSIRHLVRDKNAPEAIEQLQRIVNGWALRAGTRGRAEKLIPANVNQIISACKAILEIALGVDSIPQDLLSANVRLISRLAELFPDILTRPLTPEEMALFGKELEQEMGSPKVKLD